MRRMVLNGIFIILLTGVFLAFAVNSYGSEKNNEEQFLKNIQQLTKQGKSAGEGYFSQDGKFLIFQSEGEPGNPFYQIYMLSFETGEIHRVSSGVGKTTCSFFRSNSEEVLFASTHLDSQAEAKQQAEIEFRSSGKKRRFTWDYDEHYDIFSAQRDGSALKRLTDAPGYDAEGAYSPDGSKIVFCSLRNAYPVEKLSSEDQKRFETNPAYFGEIYLMNADGSDQKQLTNWPGYDGGPFFSPDGERIIWRHFNENGMLADVYTMRLDGSDIQRLTNFGSMSWAPYYHPSGEYIIFHSNKHGFANCELFIVDVHGEKEPVRVTFTNNVFDGLPVFSPDGKHLVWTSARSPAGESQLFLADWNHDAALAALQSACAQIQSQPSQMFNIPENPSRGASRNPSHIEQLPTEKSEQGFSPEITVADLRTYVHYLASDALEGRLTGTRGTQMAANYIADYFRKIGLKTLGDNGSYFQEFPFVSGVEVIPNKNHLQIMKKGMERISFEIDKDFRPLAFTANGEVEGQVVFAGYGLSIPGKEGASYDSYKGVDVREKIVLVLHYVPEEVDVKRRQELNPYAGLRYKAMLARERGAKALLVVIGPKSTGAGELIPLAFDKVSADSGIIVASVSGKIAEALFSDSGKSLEAAQSALDVENPQTGGCFELPGIQVKISAEVKQKKETDRNVLGFLPPGEGMESSEYVLIGAHYDHIGHGGIDSLARKGEEGQVHNGADDNASGVSTVLELAAVLTEEQKKNPQAIRRGLIFALWSGEELGLIGSSYFARHPIIPLNNIITYINFDMVGRLNGNNLIVQGVGSSNTWPQLIKKCNGDAGFALNLQNDPYLPSDATTFYQENIPVINFFTGSHEDYNRPTDDPDTLNYDGMARIAKFAQSLILDVVKDPVRPDYTKPKIGEERVQRPPRRNYLGTIPDFATDGVEGVRINNIKAGGPADNAGLKNGDIIIELAGQKVTNIYDYNYVLDSIKIGKPVEIVVLRDSERKTMTIIPIARK
ncbi:MAG: M28 family peptidase [Candidatus Jettenia sp.]|nr:M28 family peptidase [Candidatus Jettenia sp.]